MPDFELFPSEQIVGVFRGFQEGGLEFHADLVLPYRNEFQSIPMHGQFLLVQLETPDEAVLGRIASLSSEGRLTSTGGEEFNIRAVREGRAIPEDLREQYLRYRVNIRVLGVVRSSADRGLTFVPSHRRLPHVGSPVAFPSPSVLQWIAGHEEDGAPLGHLAFGEYIYASGDKGFKAEDWMQVKEPNVLVKFPVQSLVSRRSFVFARAGFGKSNLVKLLFSELYRNEPTVEKRNGKQVRVGTLIFDPDGEYFWPDDKGRPGLCDIPFLQDKLVVFTSRQGPSPFYDSFVAAGIKLDIRRLKPSDVLAIALDSERQDQQNVRKLKGLSQTSWHELVDLIDRLGHQTSDQDICRILQLQADRQQAEALAARSNMVTVVRMLHNRSSQLMDMVIRALEAGKLCVIDVSQLRGQQSLVLSGLILRHIFDRNQQQFTAAEPRTIPTIAVVEEAQTVLNERATSSEPYVAWVKEGRKYDLGVVLVTQQPGSIPQEILSQGDNWFIFHLLSAGDLARVKQANAHFSDDLLSSLLNEPIPGQGVVWSSAGGKPYPTAIRAIFFEHRYSRLDPHYDRASVDTYAAELKGVFAKALSRAAEHREFKADVLVVSQSGNGQQPSQMPLDSDPRDETDDEAILDETPPDPLQLFRNSAIRHLGDNVDIAKRLRGDGIAWRGVMAELKKHLPDTLEDLDGEAYHLVAPALDVMLGKQGEGWHSFKHPNSGATWVKAGPKLERRDGP